MGEFKYGTNFTSVKVKYAPGGSSSINLGWDEPSNQPNIRNSEKRQAIQDPFKSREGNRNQMEPDDHLQYENFKNSPHYNMPNSNKLASNPSYGQLKQVHSPEHNFHSEQFNGGVGNQLGPGNYFQLKEDPFSRPIEFPQGNYFKAPEGANNYFRAPEGGGNYLRQNDVPGKNPIYSQQGQFLMEKNFGKGQDVNYKEPEKMMNFREQEPMHGHRESPQSLGYGRREVSPINSYGTKEPQAVPYGSSQGMPYGSQQNMPYNNHQNIQYGLPPRHNNGRGSGPVDAFSGQGFKGMGANEGRGQNSYGVKNSVKVSNPPGGQSSIMFG